jgi:hypothetical protein
MPDYQKDAVATYLSTAQNLPAAERGYNVSGRAYPDISAQAADYTVIANGQVLPGVFTSLFVSCLALFCLVSSCLVLTCLILSCIILSNIFLSYLLLSYPVSSCLTLSYLVIANCQVLPGVAGTSCATPAVAGIIALLNDVRLQQGKSTLGFLNPWLYQVL